MFYCTNGELKQTTKPLVWFTSESPELHISTLEDNDNTTVYLKIIDSEGNESAPLFVRISGQDIYDRSNLQIMVVNICGNGMNLGISWISSPLGGRCVRPAFVRVGPRKKPLKKLGIEQPYYQRLERSGQYPSIELFLQLITMFDVSVDEHIHMEEKPKKSSIRRRLDAMLDQLDDKELSVVEATVNGLYKAKEQTEE